MADAEKIIRTPEEIAAEIACKAAEAQKHQAEARKFNAEAQESEYAAEAARLRCFQKKREEEIEAQSHLEWLASDYRHRTYQFNGTVDAAEVRKCIHTLSVWHRTDPKCPIEIIFHSPGGSVIDGMALYDFIQYMRQEGHSITTTARGYAASMAGILLQAGDVRQMGQEAYILIHEVSFGAGGKFGEVEDEVAFVKKIQERILAIFESRSHLSKSQLRRNWSRKDWWLDSDEALRLGLVDKVV